MTHAYSISYRSIWMTSSCPCCYRISQRNLKENVRIFSEHCAWWWPSTLWCQGVCMHIDDQVWVVHLIVNGTNTWGVNNYEKYCVSAKANLISAIRKKEYIQLWNWYILLKHHILYCFKVFIKISTWFNTNTKQLSCAILSTLGRGIRKLIPPIWFFR